MQNIAIMQLVRIQIVILLHLHFPRIRDNVHCSNFGKIQFQIYCLNPEAYKDEKDYISYTLFESEYVQS